MPRVPMGTSCDDLIVIEATNESDGISAEHRWVRENFPGYEWENQGLEKCHGKIADVVEIQGPKGETRSVYFDASKFFSKF